MTIKRIHTIGAGLLLIATALALLGACGNPIDAAPGQQGEEIDREQYAQLKGQVEDLRAQGHDVAHLEAIIADIDRWIAQDRVAEANLRIQDLEQALENLEQESPPTYRPEGPLPPAPSYAAIPQAGPEVLFAEDFSGDNVLSTWQSTFLQSAPGNMATWQQRQEALFLNMGAGGMQIVGTVAFAGEAWEDYVYSVDIFPTGNLEVGAIWHYQEKDFYRFRFLNYEHGDEGTRLLERVVGDEVTVLARADGPGYQPGQWYNVQIATQGGQIDVYLDGQPILEASDDALTGGKIGVYALSLGDVYFDNIQVTTVR